MNKTISKVVVYFTDGTYQELSNSYPLTPGAPYPNYPAPPGPINPINPMNPIPYNPPTTWSGTGCNE